MRTIEYLMNEENQNIVLNNILSDWDLNDTDLADINKLNILLYIEEKSKMVYSNLGESTVSDCNIDLYTDICLQPQNVLYTALPFQKNVSITISMNDIKAFVADIAFTLLCSSKIDKTLVQVLVIKLLVLLIKSIEIISNDIEKCVLKSIIMLSRDGFVAEKDILELFYEDFFCPHTLKKCKYLNSETNRCRLPKEKREEFIKHALENLTKCKAIKFISTGDSDKQGYCISNLIEK